MLTLMMWDAQGHTPYQLWLSRQVSKPELYPEALQFLHVSISAFSASFFPAPSSVFLCILACLSLSLGLSPCVSLSLSFIFNNHNNEKSSFQTLLGRETKGGELRDKGVG